MKTAMQEMIQNIETLEAITTDQEQIYMLTHLKVGALLLSQKEKEQIISAAKIILFNSTGQGDEAAEEYYNETYAQNK